MRVPVELQSVGNEHGLGFSLLFDPAVLSRPRATNFPIGAALILNTNQLADGRLGVMLTLPGQSTFAPGLAAVGDIIFDTASSGEPVTTFAGFGPAPWPRFVLDTGGNTLAALFAAGSVSLEPFRLNVETFPDTSYNLTFAPGNGTPFVIEASQDLISWMPMTTNVGGSDTFRYGDTNALPQRFYRVRLLP